MAQLATAEAEPLFNSAYDAIAFAYRFNCQQYAMTPMAKLMRGQIGTGKGLVGLDGAAQAGFIRGLIEQLGEWEKAALAARFAFDRKELFKARDTLIIPALASLPTGVHHRRMVDALVQKFYGERVYLKDLAELVGLHANTMTDRWRCIRKSLTELEHRAIDRAEAEFQVAGLVPF
ncbi:MAG: hypothetical protein ACYCW7_18110 [Pseudomonadaceae bacterium]